MGRASWLSRGLILLVVVGLGASLPTLFFDDAYITFRYAANLAHGDGFTYNPPERVLGVTTPLLTLLLAAAARLGADIETSATAFGLAGHALLCLAVFEAVQRLLPDRGAPRESIGLLAGVAIALHPHLAFTAMGGMETSLYCALIVLTLATGAAGRPILTGGFLGLALLTRPDAVLLAPVAAWLLCVVKGEGATSARGRARGSARSLLLAFVAAAVVSGWWILFAWSHFGSPLPHSIAAKRLIHPAGPVDILAEFGRYLRDDWYLIVALPAAMWSVARVRTSFCRAMAGFVALYVAAIVAGGVEPFAWYINPVLPILLALGTAGLADVAARVAPRGVSSRWAWWAAAFLLAAVAAGDIHRQAPELRDEWEEWEGGYEIAARSILNDSKPGDRVYVGETGVIGYLLPGRYVIDSSGINSPVVTRLRSGYAEQDPEWSRRVIRELKPDYITTAVVYLNIAAISKEPWFDALYERMAGPVLEAEGHVIYRRRHST